MESIPPACVPWPAGYDNPSPTWFPAHIDCLKIPALVSTSWYSVLQEQEEYSCGAGCLHAGADLRGQDPVQALLRPRPPLLHPVTGNFSPCTLQRKSHLCIPRKGIARPPSQFPHSCAHIFSGRRIGRPIMGIYKSLTDT
jgi:hypothetical protein